MNIGLIGFGSMGKTHAWCIDNLKYFYRDLPFEAKVVAVCSGHTESTDKAAAYLGCTPYYTEDELMRDKDIDAVCICTPNIYHFETLKKAIKAGKHIYCEKPLCITYEQASQIEALCANSNIINRIVFNNRFLPAVMKAKELIEGGRLGRIISFRCEYLHSSAADPNRPIGWKQNRDVCGAGTLFDLGAHAIDMMQFLCGNITNVKGSSQIAFPERLGPDGKSWCTNADEAFYMTCKCENGAMGTIDVSKLTVGANDEFNFSVYGEKGSLKFELMNPNWLYFYDSEAPNGRFGGERGYTRIECCGRYDLPGGIFPSFKAPIGWLRGHLHSMYDFLLAIHNSTPSHPDFSDGAAVQKVLEMALEDDKISL